jgi:inhibitor of cysteine peptidase
MNHTVIGILGIVCIIAIAIAGCTGTAPSAPATPAATATPAGNTAVPVVKDSPVQVGSIVVTEAQNGATTALNVSSTITLRLPENGTTGYLWNLTTTSGLNVTSDTFVPAETAKNVVGAGGVRVWEITAMQPGVQKIQGIYKRPWEATVGNETMFNLTINVSPA